MGVDFAVSVFPRPEAFAGDSVRFKVKVINQGNEDFSDSDNPLEVQFLAGDPGGSLSQIDNLKTVEELQAGRSTVVVSDSWTAAEGSKTIRVVLDPNGKIAEDSESGNTQDVTLLVPPASSRPDLEAPDEGSADLPEAPVMLLTVQDPNEDLLAQFGGQTPKFVYHNWENLSDTVGIEMSDRPTRDGGTTGEDLRDFPEVFRFGVDVKEISPPIRDQDAAHQNISLQAQVRFARQLKGETVEVTTTKHDVSMVGKVQEVTLSDSGEVDGTSTVQMTVREDTSVGEGDGFDLGSLVTPSSSEDPGGDDNQPSDVERLGPPKSMIRTGPEVCVRVPNATTSIFGALGRGAKPVVDAASEVEPADAAATAASAATAFIIPPDTMRALPGGVAKVAHSVGAAGEVVEDAFDPRGIDKKTGLRFASGDMKWVDLGFTTTRLTDSMSPQEKRKVRLNNKALSIISLDSDKFDLVEGEDYRFVGDEDLRRLEVSAGFFVKHLDQDKPVRCD